MIIPGVRFPGDLWLVLLAGLLALEASLVLYIGLPPVIVVFLALCGLFAFLDGPQALPSWRERFVGVMLLEMFVLACAGVAVVLTTAQLPVLGVVYAYGFLALALLALAVLGVRVLFWGSQSDAPPWARWCHDRFETWSTGQPS